MQTKTNDFSKYISIVLAIAGITIVIVYIVSGLAIWIYMSLNGYGDAVSSACSELHWRMVLLIVCVSAMILFILYFLYPKKKLKTVLWCILGGVICIPVSIWMASDLLTDIPRLINPQITYLRYLHFETDHSTEGGPTHRIEGYSILGGKEDFYISEEEYDEGMAFDSSHTDALARVVYLPASDAVYDISYIDSIGKYLNTDFPVSDELPDTWNSFAIELDGEVYTLPTDIGAFLQNGWTYLHQDDEDIILKGMQDPYDIYPYENINLINADGHIISLTIYNSCTEEISLQDGIVGEIADGMDLNVNATECRLPGGFIPGWSRAGEVRSFYDGEEVPVIESLHYYLDEGREVTILLDDGFIDHVTISNFPPFPE